MRYFICIGFIFLLTTQSHGETYSWVDDSGTYNYTEDLSRVPKKYQKKLRRREDIPQDVKPLRATPDAGTKPARAVKTDEKAAEVGNGESELYGGKSRAAWRREMEVLEAELSGIEQRMEQLQKQVNNPKMVSKDRFEALKKDYSDSRATYDQKYKTYTELIETIRKAGIAVEIKK